MSKAASASTAIELADHTTIPCDALAMSGGWSPIVNLACHKGAKPKWNDTIAAFVPPDVGAAFTAAGSARGLMKLSECLADGAKQGSEQARAARFHDSKSVAIPPCKDEAYRITPLWWVKQSTGKAFIDYQNDVTVKDLPLAAHEGYRDVELAKRYTTTGMATDQGKLGNVNAIAVLAEATGQSMDQVGTTTFRPYYTPVSFGALGGAVHRPSFPAGAPHAACMNGRKSLAPSSSRRDCGCARPGFRLPHEKDWLESVIREVKAVRERVGLCDVSTLGKIDVQGPDAGEFLNRLYCNTFSTLAVGKARYGLMLREDGIVFDDGTTSQAFRRSLLHDDDDGQCGARHVAYGILPPGAVARSRRPICLGHRAMGADGGRRPQGARDLAEDRR